MHRITRISHFIRPHCFSFCSGALADITAVSGRPVQSVVWSFLLPRNSILHRTSASCRSYTGRVCHSVAVKGAMHPLYISFSYSGCNEWKGNIEVIVFSFVSSLDFVLAAELIYSLFSLIYLGLPPVVSHWGMLSLGVFFALITKCVASPLRLTAASSSPYAPAFGETTCCHSFLAHEPLIFHLQVRAWQSFISSLTHTVSLQWRSAEKQDQGFGGAAASLSAGECHFVCKKATTLIFTKSWWRFVAAVIIYLLSKKSDIYSFQ